MTRSDSTCWSWLIIYLTVLVWSGLAPADRLTWALEAFPAVIGLFVGWYFYRRDMISPLLLWLFLIHAIVLLIGAKYTYEDVPVFEQLSVRNNYDKVGHFMQGVTPALLAREVFLRCNVLKRGNWLLLICVAISLAFSALFEIFEMTVSIILGASGDKFLATQGFVWDTQTDMLMALIGGLCGYGLLRKLQDRTLRNNGLQSTANEDVTKITDK